MQNMTHGSNGSSRARPTSSASSASSGSGSSKHVRCIGRYVLTGTTLGKGNFARVEAAVHTLTRSKIAVKIIETDKIKEEYVRKNLLREAQLMRRLRHPNIIRLYETMKTNNLYCLVTEVAEGGELLSHVRSDFKEKRLSEATTRPFVRQLVSALQHLHSTGVVHRDLKMENILLDRKKKQVKIVDFGLSNAQRPGSLLQTHCGSPEYAAPELFIPGREYGPEVDVWSLGVNMYAMLMGKLPFRSPRQGTKKRQKLLEQIQAGLSEGHEKEMHHLTREARDLIGKLLQPSAQRRVRLREVMEHPWITKDGSQPLYPYKYIPPDQSTQQNVIELMSTFLEVSQPEIRDAVKRDRCDWVAAIYNLLMDQPDGRVVIQRMLAAGPEEQLVDAAHYQGSMEHFRLSQDTAQDQIPPDVAHAMTSAIAGGTHGRAGHRHSISGDATSPYPSSTLPLTRHEKKRHHTQEPRPLAALRPPLNPVHPPPSMRRASIATAHITPQYTMLGGDSLSQPAPVSPTTELPPPSRGRRLPVTPSDEPYQVQVPNHDAPRPASRAESEPNPLPIPWRHKLVQKTQLPSHVGREGVNTGGNPVINATSPSSSPPHSRRVLSMSTEGVNTLPSHHHQLVSPLTHIASKGSKKKNVGFLRQVSKKMSSSVDAHLDSRAQPATSFQHDPRALGGGSYPKKGGHRGQIGQSRPRGDQQPMLGWASNSRMGSLPRRSKDIQALMQTQLPITSPYSSVQDISALNNGYDANRGSITSVDIKQEMFSHDGFKLSPQHGSVQTSPHGSTTVSPHGSRVVSPHTSTRISPQGSTRISPHQSMHLPPGEGSKDVSHNHMSQQHSGVMVQSFENLRVEPINGTEISKSRPHHRSVSARTASRHHSGLGVQSSDYQRDTRIDQPMIPNGAHPHTEHRMRTHHSHHHHHQEEVEVAPVEGRQSGSLFKQRRHTHSGVSPAPHDHAHLGVSPAHHGNPHTNPSYVTEL